MTSFFPRTRRPPNGFLSSNNSRCTNELASRLVAVSMPELHPRTSPGHWPVVAWIRLQLPPRPAPLVLAGALPPPPEPPLEILERRRVVTDPRKAIYGFEQEKGEGIVRVYWDADDPDVLAAEYRLPGYHGRLAPESVRQFWGWVKELVGPLGPLPVLAADPRP